MPNLPTTKPTVEHDERCGLGAPGADLCSQHSADRARAEHEEHERNAELIERHRLRGLEKQFKEATGIPVADLAKMLLPHLARRMKPGPSTAALTIRDLSNNSHHATATITAATALRRRTGPTRPRLCSAASRRCFEASWPPSWGCPKRHSPNCPSVIPPERIAGLSPRPTRPARWSASAGATVAVRRNTCRAANAALPFPAAGVIERARFSSSKDLRTC